MDQGHGRRKFGSSLEGLAKCIDPAVFIHLSMVLWTKWAETYRGVSEELQEVLVPPKLAIDAFPKRGIVMGLTEWVRTFAISERGPIPKGFQVLEESTLPLKPGNLLSLPLKRV